MPGKEDSIVWSHEYAVTGQRGWRLPFDFKVYSLAYTSLQSLVNDPIDPITFENKVYYYY